MSTCKTVPSLRTGNSEVPATNGCGCPLHIEFSGGGRPQVSTSSEMNDRPAELSEIRGCYAPQTFVDQHRDLVLYPLGDWKPVQFSKAYTGRKWRIVLGV